MEPLAFLPTAPVLVRDIGQLIALLSNNQLD